MSTWAVWRDPDRTIGVTRYRDVTEAAAGCRARRRTLLACADTKQDAERKVLEYEARFARCSFVFPSRRRCSNSVVVYGDRCATHGR